MDSLVLIFHNIYTNKYTHLLEYSKSGLTNLKFAIREIHYFRSRGYGQVIYINKLDTSVIHRV